MFTSFDEVKNLSAHKRIHNGEKRFQCGTCEKAFIHSGHLNIHKLVHSGDKPLQCDISTVE